ncbi:isoleucine--tRNA ligase, partial [candidate division WWE3 bacterium]|nr:isoleucine--tRNA ligase [candidate division WWE3 bacterium]
MTFKEVEAQPNFIDNEATRLAWWYDNGIVDKYLHRNDQSEKRFRFLDGPITANNPMGVHHAHGRTIKDFYQRYKNMRGFKQRFQNGFDCQGLWVEVEEEKDLGFDSKRDIEAFGLDKFSNSCRARVEKFSEVQADQSKRLGMFMDWDHSYYTMSERNNLHIWYFLKRVHEKGWLYKGFDAMPWCTRCGTAISQHELSDGGYKDVTHESIYVRFTLTDESAQKIRSRYSINDNHTIAFLIWTTTPWTLLSNVAVAINKKLDYALVKEADQYIIVGVERKKVLAQIEQEIAVMKGQDLLELLADQNGNIYTGPFDELDAPSKVTHRLISWDDVSDSDGTGLVHIAPGAGKEDFDLRIENDLDLLNSIDDFGDYVDGYGPFVSKNVSAVRGEIYQSLKEKNIFYKTESIHHSYPHCWRCKHELVFKTVSEWFIKADEIRPAMKKAADEAHWMPDHARKRMQDWLDNMGDWPISRQRYWGLALPFYENEDKSKFIVVESKEELKKLATNPEKVDALPELHRPWIDDIVLDGTKITLDGEKQSGVWKRVVDVGDCWLDAGIVPFSTIDYLTDKDHWNQWYPFEFITEYVAQVKLWFYATLFMSVTLEGKAPWQNVLATGFLVDEKGKAMHKSAGNSIAFDDAAREAGADPIRWLYLRERSANHHGTGNLRFGYNILDEVRRRFLAILWNTYRYFVTHANLSDWEYKEGHTSDNVLDQWILAKLGAVQTDVETYLNEFNSPDAASLLETFIVQEFSQWYIRRSRDRLSPTNTDIKDKNAFFNTTYFVLMTLSKILAPFVPFISEEIYLNLRNEKDPESVHLADWPEIEEKYENNDILEQMDFVRKVVEKGHSLRKESGIRLRQPLRNVTIVNCKQELSDQLTQVITDELNVKTVEYETNQGADVFEVSINLEIDDELLSEGTMREIIREIQSLRRNAGYAFDDEVTVFWKTETSALES